MNATTHHFPSSGRLTPGTRLRLLICAGLSLVITAFTMQSIVGAAGVHLSAQLQPTVSIQAASLLPLVTVTATR